MPPVVAAQGYVQKMVTRLAEPVAYALPLDDALIAMDGWLGGKLRLTWLGEIRCQGCAQPTRRSFAQGYCYACFRRLAACDLCVMSPDRCHYHEGTCREPAWGERHCLQPHLVYLANTSGLKVGLTREKQLPTRWIDQGAAQALPILACQSRRLAGLLEKCIGEQVSDRTHWQRMLKGPPEPLDLPATRDRLPGELWPRLLAVARDAGEPAPLRLAPAAVTSILYPVARYPDKVKALNLEKTPVVEGRLQGIKGQYLLLDSGVLNLRKYTGYHLRLQLLEGRES